MLLVTSEFPPQPGGIGNHAYNLATQLQLKGYKVTVLADLRSKDGAEEQQFDATLLFKVVRIIPNKISWFTYIQRILKYRSLVTKRDLVIASGKFSLWMVGLDPFLSLSKKNAVIHGTELNLKGIPKILINKSLPKFNKIIAVSKYTKSLVFSLKLKNIEVIPNGFKTFKTAKLSEPKINRDANYPILITVGNVTDRKGQLNVIKALPLLKEKYPKIQYHIVGIPTMKEMFKEVAFKLGVHNSIIFHGEVTGERKHQLLKESDIFVMLSNKTNTGDVEGFGIAVIEANFMGLPAIGSGNSGIADAIKNNCSGKLINPIDANAFLEAINTILKDYTNYSNNAKEWSKQFDWKIIIKKYLNTFE